MSAVAATVIVFVGLLLIAMLIAGARRSTAVRTDVVHEDVHWDRVRFAEGPSREMSGTSGEVRETRGTPRSFMRRHIRPIGQRFAVERK